MIEDWRAYTKKIREQAEGERKHMAQDRDRIQEVQAEERALWDTERTTLMASITEQNHRIAELEREVEKLRAGSLTGNITGKCETYISTDGGCKPYWGGAVSHCVKRVDEFIWSQPWDSMEPLVGGSLIDSS